MQHKLTKDKATTFEDLEQLIYDSAVEVVGRIQIKNHQITHQKRNKRSQETKAYNRNNMKKQLIKKMKMKLKED